MKLKDSKTCRCQSRLLPGGNQGTCRAGCCVVIRCPDCGLVIASFGPLGCPCKKGEVPRWCLHPDMATKTPVKIKKSARR